MSAEFRRLLDKYLTHTITISEREVLFGMLASEHYDDILAEIMDEQFNEKVFAIPQDDALRDELLEKIEHSRGLRFSRIHRVHLLRRSWFRYAAAVFLLAIFPLAIYWMKSHPVKVEQTVLQPGIHTPPGKQGALLTLGDGSTVVLDSLGNGILTRVNGTKVILQNGQLSYDNEKSTTIAHHLMTTPKARQFQLVLPDGTKVWLNCASSIRYPTIFNEEKRIVEVTGEAYFEVAQNADHPFIVKLPGNIEVQVLGTSFNVNAYTDEPSTGIVLIDGSIAMQHKDQRKLLKPGELGIVDHKGIIRISAANVEETIAWKNGQFQLSGANLPLLFRQLSRWYDIEIIQNDALPNRSFTSSISRNVPLTSILKALEIYGIHSRTERGKIIITN